MILFGCHDVGPAKYLAELISQNSNPSLCLSSKICRPIFEKTRTKLIDDLSFATDIGVVVTGSSIGNVDTNIDKQLLQWSKKRGIPSVSVVEHWSWYRRRFETADGLILPDWIIVNDNVALELAVAEGLPNEKVVVLGNPVLEVRAIQSFRKNVDSDLVHKKYNLPRNKRIIVFISEQLREDFPTGSDDYLGYDEYQVAQSLISMLTPQDHLVIKLHPVEFEDKYKFLSAANISIVSEASVEDIAYLGDLIVGMSSMLLLELAMYRNDIISFCPNAKSPFIGELLGATIRLDSIRQLHETVKLRSEVNCDFRHRFVGSRERIIRFVEGLEQ
jgi:hypothetical protein